MPSINELALALKTAYEASFFSVKENVPDFSPAATVPLAREFTEKATQAPISDLWEKLLTAEKALTEAHPAIASGICRALTKRFPCCIYDAIDGDRVVVSAVLRQQGYGTFI